MEKITRIQYWQLDSAIQQNRALGITGELDYFGSFNQVFYRDKNGKKCLMIDKDGHWADKDLLILLPRSQN